MVHADIIYSNREIQEILRNKTKEGTLYLMYDDIFFEEINKNENIRILNIEIYGNKFDNYFKED